jgi:cytochrome c553
MKTPQRSALALLSVLLVFCCKVFADQIVVAPTDMESATSIKIRSGSGDPILGKDKSQLCQGCHGENGISPYPEIPKLAGQYAVYIAKQLRNYQAGTRTHQIMNGMATSVSEEDLADISAYFASLKKMSGGGTSKNFLGKQLFTGGDKSRNILPCVNCHGINGKGRYPYTAQYPVLGGQYKVYLRAQLLNFRDSSRSNSPGSIMNITTQKLTDQEIEALADYLSAL